MKAFVGPVVITTLLAIPLVFARLGLAVEHKYIEDFTTTRHKDVPNTTARWDTVAGELKLFPLPRLAGTFDTPGYAEGVAVSGDYAYVADGFAGFQVVDISDPANPTLVGTCDTPEHATAVVVSGHHAFVADDYSGLQVIDISDPTNPTIAGAYDTPGSAVGVAVAGDLAFVCDGPTGLLIIDISDPANPTLAGTYNTPDVAQGVAVAGDHAFVADDYSGLQVIDISDPANPTLAGQFDTPGHAYGVDISGDHAFIADGSYGLHVIDVSEPWYPQFVGTCNTPDLATSVAVSGDRAYVADRYSGLQAIDIHDLAHPALAGACDTPGYACCVVVSGDDAYVADYALQVVDLSDPTIPTFTGTCDTPSYALDVVVSGIHAYVADGYSGLQVIDISDPTNPSIVGSCDPLAIYATGVAVSGDHAFVSFYAEGLYVFDISDPTNPTLVGFRHTSNWAQDVAVSGDHAFIADGFYGLQVMDISDPTNPILVGTYNTPGDADGVAVSGDYAFVADWTSGLQVIDISDPTNPTLAGTCDTPSYAYKVSVSGDAAFVADFYSGLQVIDIGDPTNPMIVGAYDTPDRADALIVSGDYALVADRYSGLLLLDITDPANPAFKGAYDTADAAEGVAISGDHAFVADNGAGLDAIRVFQSEVDSDHNTGRSLSVDETNDTIFGARLTATQSNIVTWELSADGGASWRPIAPDGSWNQMYAYGTDLVWRSTHEWAAPGVNPGVTRLEIDWLVEAASIDSIVDVPDDQGGWVLAHFTRSGRDFTGEATLPISNYGIWRRVESASLVAALGTMASSTAEKSAADETPVLGGLPVIAYQGEMYVQSRPGVATTFFPPGTWVWVATVPAVQKDTYIAAVPTVADSSASGTNRTVFVLTAHTTTPSIWYVSEPDSGYSVSVDNIAPGVPTGFEVAYNTGSGNHLSWDPCADDDFQYFKVYRGTTPDFETGPRNEVHATAETEWLDSNPGEWKVYYKITALDHVGNESDPASPETVTGVGDPATPKVFALHQNVPNPFNPETVIRYDVPAGGGRVTLRVFDVSGRLVRILVDGVESPGQKTVRWDGTNEVGEHVASGIYFCRMTAPGYVERQKMVSLR